MFGIQPSNQPKTPSADASQVMDPHGTPPPVPHALAGGSGNVLPDLRQFVRRPQSEAVAARDIPQWLPYALAAVAFAVIMGVGVTVVIAIATSGPEVQHEEAPAPAEISGVPVRGDLNKPRPR